MQHGFGEKHKSPKLAFMLCCVVFVCRCANKGCQLASYVWSTCLRYMTQHWDSCCEHVIQIRNPVRFQRSKAFAFFGVFHWARLLTLVELRRLSLYSVWLQWIFCGCWAYFQSSLRA